MIHTSLSPALIFRLVFLLLPCSLFAQSELESFYQSSYLPPELNERSADRLEQLFQHYEEKSDLRNSLSSKNYERFVYRSNYFIEKLNRSGSVFYNDTITNYLNGLKDFLLEGNPLKDEVKIYLTKQSSFNAFASDFGKVYVNVTVLARLRNEEELLALLAHEIAHIALQHTHEFEEFKRTVKKDQWKTKEDFLVLQRHKFSRSQEAEADQYGFDLLRKRGVNLEKAARLLDHLEFDLDPIHSGDWDPSLFAGDHPSVMAFWNLASGNIQDLHKSIVPKGDSLSTHPSAAKRKDSVSNLLAEGDKNLNASRNQTTFNYLKPLATKLMLNSYLISERYVEGLQEVMQLRKKDPDDPFLIKTQAKLLTLFCQERYENSPFNQFLNRSGASYSDTAFMRRKEVIYSLNSLELNLLSLISVQRLRKQYDIPYLDRTYFYLLTFLYKNNDFLFMAENGKLFFREKSYLHKGNVRIDIPEISVGLNEDEKETYDRMIDYGMVYIEPGTVKRSLLFLKHYVETYPLDDADRAHIKTYKAKRDGYDNTLTINQFGISVLPTSALKRFYRGKFKKSRVFDVNGPTAIVQSSNLFLTRFARGYFTNHKKSLDLERRIMALVDTIPQFHTNYSNLNLNELSVSDINRHYVFNQWIRERFRLDDMIYSRVDEEMQEIKKELDLKYLIYNVNVASRGHGLSLGNFAALSYVIYFDLENEGVAYVSSIASRQRPNDQMFKQLLYLWKRDVSHIKS